MLYFPHIIALVYILWEAGVAPVSRIWRLLPQFCENQSAHWSYIWLIIYVCSSILFGLCYGDTNCSNRIHVIFIQIRQGCYIGTETMVWLPKCKWNNSEGCGQNWPLPQHNNVQIMCIIIGVYRISRVSCKKGPTRHAYAWQIGHFWQDTLDIATSLISPFMWAHGLTTPTLNLLSSWP